MASACSCLLGTVYSAVDFQEAARNQDLAAAFYAQMFFEVGAWFGAYGTTYAGLRHGVLPQIRSYREGTRKQRRMTTQYCISTVNAVAMTIYAGRYFLLEAVDRRDEHVLATNAFHANAALCGYMLSDLIHELPDTQANIASIIHHCTVICFVLGSVPILPHIYRMSPWMKIAELSTIFLNLRWFAKAYPKQVGERLSLPAVEYAFGLTFFICRCAMIPLTVQVHWIPLVEKAPAGLLLCLGFIGLQLYWFQKILTKVLFPSNKED